METIKLKNREMDLEKLDKIIHEFIPAGFDVRKRQHSYTQKLIWKINMQNHVNIERAKLSIGTLGGGNHFIEVNKDKMNAFI